MLFIYLYPNLYLYLRVYLILSLNPLSPTTTLLNCVLHGDLQLSFRLNSCGLYPSYYVEKNDSGVCDLHNKTVKSPGAESNDNQFDSWASWMCHVKPPGHLSPSTPGPSRHGSSEGLSIGFLPAAQTPCAAGPRRRAHTASLRAQDTFKDSVPG